MSLQAELSQSVRKEFVIGLKIQEKGKRNEEMWSHQEEEPWSSCFDFNFSIKSLRLSSVNSKAKTFSHEICPSKDILVQVC